MFKCLSIPKSQTAGVLLSSSPPVPFSNSPFSEQMDASYQDQIVIFDWFETLAFLGN